MAERLPLRLAYALGGFAAWLAFRVLRLRLRVVKRDREAEVLRYLEREVWPSVPKGVLGRRLTRREEDQILGYGPEGA